MWLFCPHCFFSLPEYYFRVQWAIFCMEIYLLWVFSRRAGNVRWEGLGGDWGGNGDNKQVGKVVQNQRCKLIIIFFFFTAFCSMRISQNCRRRPASLLSQTIAVYNPRSEFSRLVCLGDAPFLLPGAGGGLIFIRQTFTVSSLYSD